MNFKKGQLVKFNGNVYNILYIDIARGLCIGIYGKNSTNHEEYEAFWVTEKDIEPISMEDKLEIL